MYTKGYFWTSLLIFLLLQSLLVPEDQAIILGREDGWKAITQLDGVRMKQGKRGFLNLVLDYGEYAAVESTDLLLHFNQKQTQDETGHYLVKMNKTSISSQVTKLGESVGVFQNTGGCQIMPKSNALFSAGAMWNDFTIEFWLYPASLSEGETILSWRGLRVTGKELVPQSFECRVEDRSLVWIFKDFFVSPVNNGYSFNLKGFTKLIPRTWHHHLLRYNSTEGILEYLIDGLPEGVIYTTDTFTESGSLARPILGEPDNSQLVIGKYFTGFIDELRISKEFITNPLVNKYRERSGVAVSRVFDLGYTGTHIKKIIAQVNKPSDAEVYFFYRLSDEFRTQNTIAASWTQFIPGEEFAEGIRGRYLQLRLELFPDGRQEYSPEIYEISIMYEPDLPPIRPAGFKVIPGNGQVSLSWKKVNEEDVKGYLIFYGDGPLNYMGTGSDQGNSPIDAGNVDNFQITGLVNGKLYYFSIVAYDSSTPPHLSEFANEKSARPSEVLK
jgi:hypothetical protein